MIGIKGMNGGLYRPLDDEAIEEIHRTSMRVFSEIGIMVNNREALELFSSKGARVDRSCNRVRMEPERIMDMISTAPGTIRLCGQRPDLTLEPGGTRVYAGTGGTALYVLDPGSNEKRPARLSDIKDIARVVDTLDNIHFFMLPVFPHDVPEAHVDVNRFGVALAHCSKHIMGGVYSVEGIRNVAAMAALIAGSRESLRERPIVSMVTCCGISPFVLDDHYSALAMEAAGAGIPVVTPVEPLCGATSPVTLAGNLVVQNVDTLAGIILTQMVSPGTPVFYGCISSIADMKDMKYLCGAVEMGLLSAAATQLARFYGIPIYATAGMSDSKVLDAQAGFESAITNLLVALAGGNVIHDASGLMEFCMCASLEKYVIDNEILGMVMRAVQGIEVTPDTLAFDLMKEIGPGGHFIASQHTRKYMRREHYIPGMCDRRSREEWLRAGGTDIRERARRRVGEILAGPDKTVMGTAMRKAIRDSIPGVDARFL